MCERVFIDEKKESTWIMVSTFVVLIDEFYLPKRYRSGDARIEIIYVEHYKKSGV